MSAVSVKPGVEVQALPELEMARPGEQVVLFVSWPDQEGRRHEARVDFKILGRLDPRTLEITVNGVLIYEGVAKTEELEEFYGIGSGARGYDIRRVNEIPREISHAGSTE